MKNDLLLFLVGMIIAGLAFIVVGEIENKKLRRITNDHLGCPTVVKCRVEAETEGLKSTNKKVLLRVLWWGVAYECAPVEERNNHTEEANP